MKKTTLTILTVICGLSLLIFACRRELSNYSPPDQPKVDANILEEAKILNTKTHAVSEAINKLTPGFITLQPQWNNAWTVDITGGNKYLAVPTQESTVNNRDISVRRLFIFNIENNKVSRGRIFEFIGLNYNVTPHLDYLVKNITNLNIDEFNGAIMQYDLNYRRISGIEYDHGTFKAGNIIVTKSIGGKEIYLSHFIVDINRKMVLGQRLFLYSPDTKLKVLSDGDATGSMGQTNNLSQVVIPGGPGGGGPPVGGNPPPNPDPGSTSPYSNFGVGLGYLFFSGNKPIAEYASRCDGIQGLWTFSTQNNTKNEVIGAITGDGKFIAIKILGPNGGPFSGLYDYPDPNTGVVTTYYQYKDTEGPPAQNYAGLVHQAGLYFIPLAATVHTHTPCLVDNTDGISNRTTGADADANLANDHPYVMHIVIGCNAIGSFSNISSMYSLLKTGALSDICSTF